MQLGASQVVLRVEEEVDKAVVAVAPQVEHRAGVVEPARPAIHQAVAAHLRQAFLGMAKPHNFFT